MIKKVIIISIFGLILIPNTSLQTPTSFVTLETITEKKFYAVTVPLIITESVNSKLSIEHLEELLCVGSKIGDNEKIFFDKTNYLSVLDSVDKCNVNLLISIPLTGIPKTDYSNINFFLNSTKDKVNVVILEPDAGIDPKLIQTLKEIVLKLKPSHHVYLSTSFYLHPDFEILKNIVDGVHTHLSLYEGQVKDSNGIHTYLDNAYNKAEKNYMKPILFEVSSSSLYRDSENFYNSFVSVFYNFCESKRCILTSLIDEPWKKHDLKFTKKGFLPDYAATEGILTKNFQSKISNTNVNELLGNPINVITTEKNSYQIIKQPVKSDRNVNVVIVVYDPNDLHSSLKVIEQNNLENEVILPKQGKLTHYSLKPQIAERYDLEFYLRSNSDELLVISPAFSQEPTKEITVKVYEIQSDRHICENGCIEHKFNQIEQLFDNILRYFIPYGLLIIYVFSVLLIAKKILKMNKKYLSKTHKFLDKKD